MQVILSEEEYKKIGEKENLLNKRILELEDKLSKTTKGNEKYLTFDKVEIMLDEGKEPIEKGKTYEDIVKERQKKVICNGEEWYMFCHKIHYTDWLLNEAIEEKKVIEEKIISISNVDKKLVFMNFCGNDELMVLAFNNLKFELMEEEQK